MIQVTELLPGVTLRCFPAERFKQGCLSLQFLRPMASSEAALNALIPAILLRGTREHPDLRSITLHLDDLYGASVGTLVRRVGDYQTMGFYCGFIEDKYALTGDQVLEPMVDFVGELLLHPALGNGVFCREFVQSEKRNLITTIEAERNDKRAYAASRLLRKLCSGDSFGIPRLGEREWVEAITPETAWEHYCRVLKESPVEIFYVGSVAPETVAARLKAIFLQMERNPIALPAQTAFQGGDVGDFTECMEVAQGKLSMGFVTPITNRDAEFAAMQVMNTLFGAGMTSKLFNQIREKMSLCYYIGSSYYGGKGMLTVAAGIDSDKHELVKQEILNQLRLCAEGGITEAELTAAKEAFISSLRAIYDSTGSIESYEFIMAVSKMPMTPEEYEQQVQSVTLSQVCQMAKTLSLHTTFFLKGVDA